MIPIQKSRFAFLLRLPVVVLLAHVYVAIRLSAGLPDAAQRWAIVAALAVIYVIVIIGFSLRHAVGRRGADAVCACGFFALGLFSWLFVLTVVREAVLLAAFVLGFASDAVAASAAALAEITAVAVLGLSAVATVAGLFNAHRRPVRKEIDVFLPALPLALDGFTIAQITDLHVGPTIKKNFVRKVVDMSNAMDADIIALTGDLIDGRVDALRPHTNELSRLSARAGVYAVTGNHEYYAGAPPWIAEWRRLGFCVLLNQHVVLDIDGHTLVLAGVTDFGAAAFDDTQASDPAVALKGAPADAAVRILLAHQPRSMFEAARAGFDLQLSGHTHGGQFWPWGYFVPLQQPLVAGLHAHEGMQVYVSRGTGYWGPPLRLGARSEVSLIRLRRASPHNLRDAANPA